MPVETGRANMAAVSILLAVNIWAEVPRVAEVVRSTVRSSDSNTADVTDMPPLTW